MDEAILIIIVLVLLAIVAVYGLFKLIGRTIEYLEVKTTYYKLLIEKERKDI